MKLHILIFVLSILTTISCKQSTKLSFLTEYENQQQQDYIKLTLEIKAQGTSLVNVMKQASNIAEQIQKISNEFCQSHTKKKSQCKNIVQIGNYDIKPKYQIIKRQSKFIGFQVQHQVQIKVFAVNFISQLADTILKQKNTKIISFQWEPLQQSNVQQSAVKLGRKQGQQLCNQINMHLNKIKNLQEINKSEQKNENVSVYKFIVQCLPGKIKNKLTITKTEQKENSKKIQYIKKSSQQKIKQKKDKKPITKDIPKNITINQTNNQYQQL